MKQYFWLFLFICFVQLTSAQKATLRGIVYDDHQRTIPQATIRIGDHSTSSDTTGYFTFPNLPAGKYRISVSALGYQSILDSLWKKDGEELVLTLTLTSAQRKLEEVQITGQSNKAVKEQPIRAIVIDTRRAAEQPATLAELMNRASGIRIRQSGGLGNNVDVSVNGFQGNAVQYFKDGIPLEYLGGGYGINNVPLNLLERVEVYRGVVPVSLGGDALGGAVNLVTNKQLGSRVNASYEIASFNTHIANLSFYKTDKKDQKFVGLDAFYNYSDNDYRVDVEVPNASSNYDTVNVRLFHNAYKHQFAELYFGLKNKSWADEIRLSVAGYDIHRESQHPALMTNPYGAIELKNKGITPSLRYKKNLLDSRLTFDQFLSYSFIQRNRTDTLRGTYDWYGRFTPRAGDGIGESPTPSLSDIDFNNAISRSYIAFDINAQNRLEANVIYNYNQRKGSDPYGFRFTGTDIDVLSKKASYGKLVAGLSWASKWMDTKLTNQLFAKYFRIKSTGINAFLSNDTDLDKYTTATDDNWGFGDAIKYQIDERSFVRASAELTNRLPRSEEIFGNNDTQVPNFNLKPERSLNINIGYRYAYNRIAAEIGGFYRKTKGMILLVPIQSPFAQYQNLDSIRGYGFDIDVAYQVHKNIEITGNATWQDNRMTDVGTTLYKWIEGTRVRNTPYFFANLGASGRFAQVFQSGDLLKPYVYYNFVREFYLTYVPKDKEPQGLLGLFGKSGVPIKDLVPDQHLLTMGLNYTFPSSNLIIGAEVKNLTNEKLFDYYKVQRPGRSIHIKLNYSITYTKDNKHE